MRVKFIAVCLFVLSFVAGSAQEQHAVNIFNADMASGLPVNYVYSALSDRYGYLWLCTPKGVVRYNGYEYTLYNITDGLSDNDVWGLYLDKKNRVWLRSITNRLGYIKDNRYREAQPEHYIRHLYPRHIADYDSGVFTIASLQKEEDSVYGAQTLYLEKNGILYDTTVPYQKIEVNVGAEGELVVYEHDKEIQLYAYRQQQLQLLKKCFASYRYYDSSQYRFHLAYKRHLVEFEIGSNLLEIYDLDNCSLNTVRVTDSNGTPEQLLFADYNRNGFYLITQKHIYRLDDKKVIPVYAIGRLAGKPGNITGKEVTDFYSSSFWGQCITTRNNGFFLDYGTERHINQLDFLSGDYKYIGTAFDTLSFWWHKNERRLVCVTDKGMVKNIPCPLEKIYSMVEAGEGKLLVSSYNQLYLLSLSNYRFQHIPVIGDDMLPSDLGYIKSLLATGQNSYVVSGSYEVKKGILQRDTFFCRPLQWGRYDYAQFSPSMNTLYLYRNSRIVIRHGQDKEIVIEDTLFKKWGILNIEKIIIDEQYGNVFIKDYKKLYMLHIKEASVRPVFTGVNLEEAQCAVKGNNLVLAGKFGVLFIRISGPGRLGGYKLYPNVKARLYKSVSGMAILKDNVHVHADGNMYAAAIPPEDEYDREPGINSGYNLLASYHNRMYNLLRQPHIDIVPGNNRMKIDIINPRGVGAVSYKYAIKEQDEAWTEVSGDELLLPGMEVNRYYTLLLKLSDDVWESRVIPVKLFIVPRWWQKPSWRLAFWICGILLLLAFTATVVWLTRYYVARAGAHRQFMTELQLRAIYSQINPHFIFNTLNIALFFIKKNQLQNAYQHITRFSRLLRAYIDSSRNRYISLRDEISNLVNYIELQQARFDNAFTYDIKVDNIPDTGMVHIPSLLLQPLVENAINHGLLPKEEKGNLLISFYKEPGAPDLFCVIDDDGIGRARAKEMKEEVTFKRKSYGSDLLKELVLVFNRYEKTGIEITYTDKVPPLTGTKVTIRIKNTTL